VDIGGLSKDVRSRLVAALRKELLGPSEEAEALREFPTSRYVVGRLAPAQTDGGDDDSRVDPAENDNLSVAVGSGDDDGSDEPAPSLIIGFNPSSVGISFLVDPSVSTLRVAVSWADYRRERNAENVNVWQRYSRRGTVDCVPLRNPGTLARVLLSPGAANPAGVIVSGVDDAEIALEGVVREFAGYKAVSLFLVNRRTKGDLGDRNKDERWIFQPSMSVRTNDVSIGFVAKDFQSASLPAFDDADLSGSALLYRHAREFATGHGVATGWVPPQGDGRRTAEVFTEFLPAHEVPLLVAQGEQTGAATLDMKRLATASSRAELVSMVEPLIVAYESWIEALFKASAASDIQGDPSLREAARTNLEGCRECARRMRGGLRLLQTDDLVVEAFRFANRAMWDQRTHSLWAASNRKGRGAKGTAADHDSPATRTWRPFQMGFILLNLLGIADETSEDRLCVDLLWFPTGGGKTEAYLGLAAFTLALRRLRGDRHGMHAGAGVSIIMRYTLRLLTVQQFQRATALICACEVIRRSDPKVWGTEPFRIGVWVGRGTTPNTFEKAKKALDDIGDGRKPRDGSPIQLVSCPRCGTALLNEKGGPQPNTYVSDDRSRRTLTWCCNQSCEFAPRPSASVGLPVVVVDDEIYRTCPSLIVATVDKFARLPFKGETQALFGLRNRFSPTLGHITEAHGDKVGGRLLRDAIAAPRLLPPDLIIQDELHLISGPLGTMVGLYETAVDYACSHLEQGGPTAPAKIIASTATIRRAAQQAHQLYGGRRLTVFPPPGLSAKDSFFARELPIEESAGRLYLGINAPGFSTKTLLVRVYAALLALAGTELKNDPNAADPYGTLVGYFNSLRALGGAKRLVEDDINQVRLRYLSQRLGPRRYIAEPAELTSRLDSWKIPELLERLDKPFPRTKQDWPVDVLLATNMISVGVDIDRLGLMVVAGQPKATAEYIQATSRVGRKHPGLVVTMYNWMSARDLSHYERFESYHSALYRYVEAISVTPFSSRALDRGLRAIFVAMHRLHGDRLAKEPDAQNFDSTSALTEDIIRIICKRATNLVGVKDAALVHARLLSHRDEWARLAQTFLRYSWLDETQRPPNNSRVLLRTSGTQNEGAWAAPGSLREVEPAAAFYLADGDSV
jgi:hypothetical protein